MKLKYYLRGMGIGIILTAIVMGFALGGRKATLSDAEIIQRAKALGMVDGDSGVLLDSQDQEGEEKTDDTSASSTPLFEEGAKIPEKEQQEVSGAGASTAEMAQEKEESEAASSKASEDKSSALGASTKETENSASAGKSGLTEDSASSAKTTETASAISAGISTSSKTVTIPGGLGSDQVAQILVREGIIDNAVSFNKYLVDSRKDRIIRSGVKTIPAGATYEQIASIITR